MFVDEGVPTVLPAVPPSEPNIHIKSVLISQVMPNNFRADTQEGQTHFDSHANMVVLGKIVT